MQNKITSILKIFVPVLLVTAIHGTILAQGGDSIRGKGLFTGISLGPSQSQIINNGTASVAGIVSEKVTTFSGSAEIGYYFSKYFGLSSGFGYNSYREHVSLAEYQNMLNTIDSENDAMELRVTGTNIKEEQIINYLYVPIYLNIRLPLKGAIGLFLQSGVNLAFPLKQTYTSNGTFTYKGYYSKYNVLLENLPKYGFPTNKATTAEGQLEVKSFTAFVVATAGIDFFVTEKLQLAVAATYDRSLSDVAAYTANTQYQLSPAEDQINSFMGGTTSVTASSMGISVRLRYYF